MGSHSVTCHPTEVRIPPLPPAEAGTRFSDPGGMQGWVDLCYVKATGRELNPRPVNRKSNALLRRHHTTCCSNRSSSYTRAHYKAVLWAHLVHLMNAESAPDGHQPLDKPWVHQWRLPPSKFTIFNLFLGRLLWVDLIKWVSNVRRPSVRLCTKVSLI